MAMPTPKDLHRPAGSTPHATPPVFQSGRTWQAVPGVPFEQPLFDQLLSRAKVNYLAIELGLALAQQVQPGGLLDPMLTAAGLAGMVGRSKHRVRTTLRVLEWEGWLTRPPADGTKELRPVTLQIPATAVAAALAELLGDASSPASPGPGEARHP